MMNGWDGWDWVWMTLMMVAFWGGLAAVIVFAIKALGGSRRRSETPAPDAMTVPRPASPRARSLKTRSRSVAGCCSDREGPPGPQRSALRN